MSQSWFYGNRLTPEPEGGREGVVRVDARVNQSVLDGWAREMKRDVFEAIRNQVVIPDNYCLQTHQARVDAKPPKPSDVSWRQGELIAITGNKPPVLVDSKGVIAAWIFPSFMKRKTLDYHNEFVTQHAQQQFPAASRAKGQIRGSKTNGLARAGAETYTTTHGIFGTATYCIAWHQLLHQNDRSFNPSKDLVDFRSVKQVVQRDLFFSSFRDIHWKLNQLISLVHPALYDSLLLLRSALEVHPSCARLLPQWESIFPGHSLICNRTTGEHIDPNGLRRGFEAILAGGSFSGGALYLKDINARLRLLPGTLVLLDGTSQRHKVEPWNGDQRFSHVFFAHRSVFAELNLPHTLPDVTIHSITSRLGNSDTPSPNSAYNPSASSTTSQARPIGSRKSSSSLATRHKRILDKRPVYKTRTRSAH